MDMIIVGPAGEGGQFGTRWDEKGRDEVAQIFVSYTHDTVAVTFDYPTEFLTSISGSFRKSHGSTILNSISFGTNKGSYGPFGTPSDNANKFTFQIGNYPSFGGFHGSKSDHGIDSFGIYRKPIKTSMIHFNDPMVKDKKEGVQEEKTKPKLRTRLTKF